MLPEEKTHHACTCVGQARVWEYRQGSPPEKSTEPPPPSHTWTVCMDHGWRKVRPNMGTGILSGNIQAWCPCGWFKETKPPTSQHPDPLTVNTYIPKEHLPAGNKDSKINTNELETVISKKGQFSLVLEEEDGTANCRLGRTHLSPFSMLIPPLWLIKRCYKFILLLFSTTRNKHSGYLKSITESIICKSRRIRTTGHCLHGTPTHVVRGKKQTKYIKNHFTLFLTSSHKVTEKYKARK